MLKAITPVVVSNANETATNHKKTFSGERGLRGGRP
jgi:hypothetical protein